MIGDLQARARRGLGLMSGADPRGWRTRRWLMLAGVTTVLAGGGAMAQSQQSGSLPGVSLPVVSRPVVQPLPSEGGAAMPVSNDPARMLSNALGRVGRNPRDADALADAGNAAMAMGDEGTAAGFYARADKIAPDNPHVAAGWATAKLHGDDPIGAIALYDQAARNGQLTGEQLSDRGLAHDLVGDNASAQRFYREALATGANDEAMRRLALSEAMGGDRKAMEATLAPLLQKQDRAAWRTRAFAFAILGREDEAVAIARSTMPAEMATGMAPFLRFMRKLTPAQQAAAANLGRFPHASEIGKDDARVIAYAAQHGIRRLAAADAPLVPAGAPLGVVAASTPTSTRREDSKSSRKKAEEAAVAARAAQRTQLARNEGANPLPPEPNPSREVSPPPALATAIARPAPPAVTPAVTGPRHVADAPPVTRPVTPAPQQGAPQQGPGFSALAAEKPRNAAGGFDLARLPAGEAAVPRAGSIQSGPIQAGPVQGLTVQGGTVQGGTVQGPVVQPLPPEPKVESSPPPVVPRSPVPAPVAPAARPLMPAKSAPPRKASFAEAFSAWGTPPTAAARAISEAPASGAVDLRKITPPRPVKAPPKAPPPPPNPSRVWVQVGVGRSAERIAFDWRKLSREEPKLLSARKAWTSDWGRTNRVLVGPFDDEDEAKSFVGKMKKAGHDDTFVWLSPDGQAVDPLGR